MQIGMIGLGRMGANMVQRLMNAGHECVVFDINAGAVTDLAAQGAGLYRRGYIEVARRNFLRPFCQPDHPLSPGARPFGARGLR